MAHWMDKYPWLTSWMQRPGEHVAYAPDVLMMPAPDTVPSRLRGLYEAQGRPRPPHTPSRPLYERFCPPMDVAPELPLTREMVDALWTRIARDVSLTLRRDDPPAGTVSPLPVVEERASLDMHTFVNVLEEREARIAERHGRLDSPNIN